MSARAANAVPSLWLDPARVEQIGWNRGRPKWITLAPLRYRSAMLGTTIVVPPEFITDLASVPRAPLTWLIAGGRAPRPAIVHDYGYQRGEIPLVNGGVLKLSRSQFDALFSEGMAVDPFAGVNGVTRRLMWAAVRVGGIFAWQGGDGRAVELNPVWTLEEGWPQDVQAGG